MITSGLVLIACGVPLGDLGAEIQHHDAVGQIHHESHIVFHQQHRHAAVAQLAQQGCELQLFHVTQAGRRFIEQYNIGSTHSARAISTIRCWPSGQAPGQLIDLVAETDTLDLARCFRQ